MIPNNASTESAGCQESNPMCQRACCPNRGTTYSEATRRCTIQLTQEVELPVVLNGLSFVDKNIVVDLCIICYHCAIKHDKAMQITYIVGVGPYQTDPLTECREARRAAITLQEYEEACSAGHASFDPTIIIAVPFPTWHRGERTITLTIPLFVWQSWKPSYLDYLQSYARVRDVLARTLRTSQPYSGLEVAAEDDATSLL